MNVDPLRPLRNLPPEVRAYYYRLALAGLALAALVAGLGPDDLEALAEVIGAVLGLGAAGLATVHTDRPRPRRERVRRGQPVPDHDPTTRDQ